jgi:hypothetical protein
MSKLPSIFLGFDAGGKRGTVGMRPSRGLSDSSASAPLSLPAWTPCSTEPMEREAGALPTPRPRTTDSKSALSAAAAECTDIITYFKGDNQKP